MDKDNIVRLRQIAVGLREECSGCRLQADAYGEEAELIEEAVEALEQPPSVDLPKRGLIAFTSDLCSEPACEAESVWDITCGLIAFTCCEEHVSIGLRAVQSHSPVDCKLQVRLVVGQDLGSKEGAPSC